MKKSLLITLLAACLGLSGCQQDSASSTDMQNTGSNASSTTSTSTQPASTPEATPAKATEEKKS
jgi:ABC-type glycerol-3-phosphate transport system substrate-binding protein